MASILVVDDEVGIRELLSEILSDEGYTVRLASSAEAAREARRQERPDLVLLDIWMPDTDGISLLKDWASRGQLTMPVVMMSGHASIDSAVEAMRIGALDFLEKPIALQKLLGTVKRALASGETHTPQALTLAGLGRSARMQDIRRRVQALSQSTTAVLLRGEVGMMAEIYARALQQVGAPFIAAASTLAEAPQDLLQRAAGGIVYVEDLFTLSRGQHRGLALIAPRAARQNVRLVTYASDDPERLVLEGSMERDTLARITEVILPIPALRDHPEDIPDIASILLAQLVESRVVPPRRFSTGALNLLRNYEWPRNLEQLQQVVRSVALTAIDDEIVPAEIEALLRQFATSTPAPPVGDFNLPLREARDAFERAYFEHLLAVERGSMSRVAERSGMERTHLYRKLKQLGIPVGKRDEA
jgi:DNA-binding NtrC family response regulator